MVDTVALEFVSVGCTEDFVAGYFGGDNLADDIAIREADDEAVFGGIVLVLGLGDEALTSVVIGLACAATFVLDLVSAADQSVVELDRLTPE